MKLLLFAALLCLSSCATTYKDFRLKHVEKNEGAAIGSIKIIYNGKVFTKECSVCLHSLDGPCQKLTEEGLVFMNLKTGERSVRRIVCMDTSLQHYNIEGAAFTQTEGTTYFGNITVDWTNAGGFKTSSLFGAVGAIVSESSNDGTIKMQVSSEGMAEVVHAFETHTNQKNLKVTRSLAKVGK